MKSESSFIKNAITMTIAVVVGVFAIVASVQATTTISTSITTGGDINTAGALAASSTVIASSTVGITGTLTTYGQGVFGDAAADHQVFNGRFQASSTALFGSTVGVSATSTLATSTITRLFVGSTTPQLTSAEVIVDGTATTTVYITSSGAADVGSCIQMKGPAGANTRIYVGGAGTNLVVEAGTCK